MISSPARPQSHSDADMDCQQAAEGEFHALARRMEAAGWSGDHVARALLELALAHIKGRIGKAAVDRAIRAARQSVDGR